MSFLEDLLHRWQISPEILTESTNLANIAALCYGEDLRGVILFGSQRDGRATSESDIDLLIVVDSSGKRFFEDRQEAARLYAAAEEEGLDWERFHLTVIPFEKETNQLDKAMRDALGFGKDISFDYPGSRLQPCIEERHAKKAFGLIWGGMMS